MAERPSSLEWPSRTEISAPLQRTDTANAVRSTDQAGVSTMTASQCPAAVASKLAKPRDAAVSALNSFSCADKTARSSESRVELSRSARSGELIASLSESDSFSTPKIDASLPAPAQASISSTRRPVMASSRPTALAVSVRPSLGPSLITARVRRSGASSNQRNSSWVRASV